MTKITTNKKHKNQNNCSTKTTHQSKNQPKAPTHQSMQQQQLNIKQMINNKINKQKKQQ